MPLQKLSLRPGFFKDATDYANEGGWFDGDKVRFRKSFPEKIGGWQKLSDTSFLGLVRNLLGWTDLSGFQNIGVGSSRKYYVFRNSVFNDITPVSKTSSAGDVSFSATSGSSVLVVTDQDHGVKEKSFVVFSGAVGLGGAITADVLNQEYEITSILDEDSYFITARTANTPISAVTVAGSISETPVLANASDTGDGGASVVGTYLVDPTPSETNPSNYAVENSVYNGVNFSLTGQDTSVSDLVFTNDGLKMFALGAATDAVYQYSLTTAFDISTATYDSISFSVSSQIATPLGLVFNSDGSKMFVSGTSPNKVFQYSLTTAFDISTASYDNISLDAVNVPSSLEFSNTGFQMYTASIFSDEIYQYSLTTAFDISTATYTEVSVDLFDQTNAIRGFSISKDGARLYVLGSATGSGSSEFFVFQYELTPFDVSSATYNGKSFSIENQAGDTGQALAFSSDNKSMFVCQFDSDNNNPPFTSVLYQYNADFGAVSWSHDVFGEDLLINQKGSQIYYWDTSGGLDQKAVPLSTLSGASDVPLQVNQVMVSDRDRHVLAFGCTPQGGTEIDPMLIRFSDQENPAQWTATASNTAGDLVLGSGSEIVRAVETRQQTLVLTDTAAYALQYLGPPFTFGVTRLSDNISIMSPTSATSVDDLVVWMGKEEFFIYDGTIKPLPCSVRDFVFETMDQDRAFKVTAGTNTAFGEIWWFYPCSVSSECDRYVVYNYQQQIWYTGTLRRDAWLDRAYNNRPVAADGLGNLFTHEIGNDDGSTTPVSGIHAYVESSPIDVEDGDQWVAINQLLPDLDFRESTGSSPTVEMTLKAFNYPGQGVQTTDSGSVSRSSSGTVDLYTGKLDVRLTGRAFGLRVESTGVGVAWRSGAPRIDILPGKGRR